MGCKPAIRLFAVIVVLAVLAPLGCRSGPDEATGGRASARFEVTFVGPDHEVGGCLKALGDSLIDHPDGVLFFDRDSRIKVKPPRGRGVEPYHVHLEHRVAGETLDALVQADESGLIEIDLGRFNQPELLIVTSAGLHLRRKSPGQKGAEREEAPSPVTAPYAMSFRLVPSDQAELLMSLQHFRYDVKTPVGTLSLFVQSYNRRDMLLAWVDARKKLDVLIKEDPYVYLKSSEGYVPPRVLVEVYEGGGKGRLWQRAGTWHIPDEAGSVADSGKRPFVFRTAQRELIAFDPPARVDLALPDEPSATSARVTARFSGVDATQGLRFVLAGQYPTGPRGESSVRVQSQEITAENPEGSYLFDLSDLDQSRFPLTTTLAHRLVQPWVMHAGMYDRRPPRGVASVSLDGGSLPRLHARILTPRYASHFDWITFFGGSGARGSAESDRTGASDGERPGGGPDGGPGDGGPGDGGPSPNVVPPPPPGFMPPPPVPPVAGPPPAAPITPPPGAPPGGGPGLGLGLGAAGLGGGSGACGCGLGPAPGLPSPNCPREDNKCKGYCGQACPANGHCKSKKSGEILVKFPCPPKPQGCGNSIEDCKCPAHMWDMWDAMNSIQGLFPGAADFAWFGAHGASAPCHEKTVVAQVRVTFWGAGFQLIEKWYDVAVTFEPCVKLKGGKVGGGGVGVGGGGLGAGTGPGAGPGAGGGGPAASGGSGAGSGPGGVVATSAAASTAKGSLVPVTLTSSTETSTTETTAVTSVNDPGVITRATSIGTAVGVPFLGGSTLSIPTSTFAYDELTLGGIASMTRARNLAIMNAYWGSGTGAAGLYLGGLEYSSEYIPLWPYQPGVTKPRTTPRPPYPPYPPYPGPHGPGGSSPGSSPPPPGGGGVTPPPTPPPPAPEPPPPHAEPPPPAPEPPPVVAPTPEPVAPPDVVAVPPVADSPPLEPKP